jgi:AcrR family transcriptional regulator
VLCIIYIITDDVVNYDERCYISSMPPRSAPQLQTQSEPRGARRKRETRFRLLDAAMRLIGEKGLHGVAINDITEAADVGFGTFFNHFKSKEAIYAAVAEQVFQEFVDWLERVSSDISDPAEIVAVSIRHGILRARREPVWGKFVVRAGLSRYDIDHSVDKRLLREIKKGIDGGRFPNRDLYINFITIRGAILYCVNAVANEIDHGFSTRALPERVASCALRILGLGEQEADEIARRQLPK